MYSNETKGLIPQAAAERIGNEGCPAWENQSKWPRGEDGPGSRTRDKSYV